MHTISIITVTQNVNHFQNNVKYSENRNMINFHLYNENNNWKRPPIAKISELCGRPIGHITRLAHPSVPYWLVTQKQKNIKKLKLV